MLLKNTANSVQLALSCYGRFGLVLGKLPFVGAGS